MFKLHSFLSLCGARTPRLTWCFHNTVDVKWLHSELQKCTLMRCTAQHKWRYNSSYTPTQISTSQVLCTKAIADKLYLNYENLLKCITESPNLLNIKMDIWQNCFRELASNGFTDEDFLRTVTICPSILQTDTQKLRFGFQVWRGSSLGEKNVLALLKHCPHFILLPEREVSVRLAHLKALGTAKGVVLLLRGAPNLMDENWNDILTKISFLKDEMRVQSKHILKSFALNRSVIFLKTRFIFLERCGKYVKPKVDADPNIPSKNHPLSKIVETDDEDFATLLAGVTLEEYEVFQELFAVELEDSELNASDSE